MEGSVMASSEGVLCRIKQTFELGIAPGEREDGEEKSGKLLRTYMDR